MAKRKYQEGGEVEGPEAWGAIPAGRRQEGDAEDLGRGLDMSFLGEAAQDPTGAAIDFVRSGEAGGLDLIRQGPFSEFPMEPGTSRAAKELPELFIGGQEMDPRFEQLNAVLNDPKASTFAKMGAMMELREREEMMVSPTRRTGSGVLQDIGNDQKLWLASAAMTMHDPAEIAMLLTQTDEQGNPLFPDIGIQTAPDGTIIVGNNKTGHRAVINRPGWSMMDTMQALGLTAMFTPAGRITGAIEGTAARMGVGALTASATEAAIQQGQEMAGGQFDKLDVALSAGIGPLIDIARPLMGLAQRSGRFIGSYIPENFFGLQTKFEGLKEVLGPRKQQVLDFVQRMKPHLQSKRPAILTTQDAVPEAHTPFRQILLKMVERMPLTGTGGLRIRQREQRVEVLRWLADKYDLNVNTRYGYQVAQNLNRRAGARLDAARQGIDTAIDQIGTNDIVLRDFRLNIKSMIDQELKRGDLGDKGTIALLDKVRNQIWQGVDTPAGQKFPRDFGTMNDWLEYLYTQAANAPPRAKAAINEVADSLKADLTRHAKEEGGSAGAAWIRATNQLDDLVRTEEKGTLRSLIEAGDVDEQVVRKVMATGDDALIGTMVKEMTPTGREHARRMFLQDGLYKAGWRSGPADDLIADPKKLMSWMDNNNTQLESLFPAGEERNLLEGMREYLRMTGAAQETGKGVGMAASGGFGQKAANAINLITLGLVGAAGNAYQSAPVRNLLLRLYHVKSDPAMKDMIMQQITPMLMAGGRMTAQEWDSSDEHDMVYASEGLLEAMGKGPPPGVAPDMMQQLEQAAGTAEEEQSIGARLLEMLGMGGGEEEEAVVEEP